LQAFEQGQRFMLWIGYNFGFLHNLLVFFHADSAYLSIYYLCYLGIA
jgi:hypothetical protein